MVFLRNSQLLQTPYYLPLFLILVLLMCDPLENFLHCPVCHAWVHKYFWILFSNHATSHVISFSHFILSRRRLLQTTLEQSSNPGRCCPHVNNDCQFPICVFTCVAVLKPWLEMTHCLRYMLHFWDSTTYSFALKCIIDLFELMYFSPENN